MTTAERALNIGTTSNNKGLTPVDIRIGALVHRVAEVAKLAEGSKIHGELLKSLGQELADTPGALDVLRRIQS